MAIYIGAGMKKSKNYMLMFVLFFTVKTSLQFWCYLTLSRADTDSSACFSIYTYRMEFFGIGFQKIPFFSMSLLFELKLSHSALRQAQGKSARNECIKKWIKK